MKVIFYYKHTRKDASVVFLTMKYIFHIPFISFLASSFIKQALEYEYPKLLRLYTDLIKKLQKLMKKHPTVSSKGVRNLFQNE